MKSRRAHGKKTVAAVTVSLLAPLAALAQIPADTAQARAMTMPPVVAASSSPSVAEAARRIEVNASGVFLNSAGDVLTAKHALPRAPRTTEVDLDGGGKHESLVIGHFLASIPGQLFRRTELIL
jgi:S1-C subfamily serine protease